MLKASCLLGLRELTVEEEGQGRGYRRGYKGGRGKYLGPIWLLMFWFLSTLLVLVTVFLLKLSHRLCLHLPLVFTCVLIHAFLFPLS